MPKESKRRRMTLALATLALAIAAVGTLNGHAADAALQYQRVENWAKLPDGTLWGVMTAVDIDSKGNIYAFQRGEPTSKVIVFDAQGKYLKSWGADEFPGAHSLRVLRDGSIWITDRKLEQVLKFDTDGKALLSIGQKGVAGDNNSEDSFNGVSDVAMAANGDLFVSDGEGPNTRIVKFTKEGKFIKFWGTKGSDPGQFVIPHNVAIDSKGRVWVCDRGNKRLQVFDQDGKFLDQFTQFGTASSLFITSDDMLYVADGAPENRIIIGTTDGKVLGTIDGLNGPHSLAVDSSGAVYVAESGGKSVLKYMRVPAK